VGKMRNYNHIELEKKWQKYWHVNKVNKIDLDASKKPFYNLMMFPYPSAEGLHIGSVYTFTGIDVYGRYKAMQGFDVFEPFGLDGFGIHSENYALKIGENIRKVSARTEKHYYEQMLSTGNMIDWDRKLETYDPNYYKWTQWLFVQLFKAGLAYRKESDVNWCPSCKTVLSDEQVIDGHCERCNTVVVKKSMNQWFFKITDFAQRLLKNLETLDWVDDVKTGQKNWIGMKSGIEIDYPLVDKKGNLTENMLTVFTTRPDTNFGASFVVVSPEHPILEQIVTPDSKTEVNKYVKDARSKSDLERTDLAKVKSGVFTGSYCYSRLTKKKLPIWVADFVLMNFGTGAVVGVPGHDKKDFEFAQKYGLEIIRVVSNGDDTSEIKNFDQVQEESGIMINSEFLNGQDIMKAKEMIMDELEKRKEGRRTTTYRLRDWCVSRQRYWGPPIPMIFCDSCKNSKQGYYKEEMPGWWPDENLPILLPEIENQKDTIPDNSGKGALARLSSFFETKCPHCGSKAKRETDVSDSFVDSSWYFLRYPFTEYGEIPFGGDFSNPESQFNSGISKKEHDKTLNRMKKWGPVTSYIGGKEHTVLHLLYARFITMALHDMGYLDFEEPFTRFYGHGLITKDGAKMSKSKGNVINPDEYFEKYGADSVRMYLRFMGPFDQGGDWSDTGMHGMYRFINKLYKIYQDYIESAENDGDSLNISILDKTVKKVTDDLENLKFNTIIAELMKLVNWYTDHESELPKSQKKVILETLLLMLAPFIPHLAEELWEQLGNKPSIHAQKWPSYNQDNLKNELMTIAVQIDGKTRGTIQVNSEISEEEIKEILQNEKSINKYITSEKPRRFLYIKNKIISIVN
jgi:leucyl-tRNA synthetase